MTRTQTSPAPLKAIKRRTFFTFLGLSSLATTLVACGAEEKNYESYVVNDNGETLDPRQSHQDLGVALEELRADKGLSVAVYDYAAQESFFFNPEYRGYEASVVKIPIALTVMRLSYLEQEGVDEETAELIKASVGYSDNDATAMLYSSLGEDTDQQDAAINETYEKLGISDTQSTGGWGVNLTSASDQVSIARAVYEGVDWVGSQDMDLLRGAMEATDPSSQGWGIGVLANILEGQESNYSADKVLCKNGWISDDEGIWYINSTGAILHGNKTYAISVLVNGFSEQEDGQQMASATVEKIVECLDS